MKNTTFILSLFSLFFACAPVKKENLDTTEEKIDSIISLMTIEEKIGQMTQVDQQFLDTILDISVFKTWTSPAEVWASIALGLIALTVKTLEFTAYLLTGSLNFSALSTSWELSITRTKPVPWTAIIDVFLF